MRVLILGGTGEANQLAYRMSRAQIDAIYSYAGRTKSPLGHPLPTHIGGFGGAAGLAQFIWHERITHVIDATHAFAAQMSHHALEACTTTGTALLGLERAPWTPVATDRWIEVANIAAAVRALTDAPVRVFLAIGRHHVAPFAAKPQHAYTLRFVDPPDEPLPLPNADVVVSRGPFTVAGDRELMSRRGIEWLVARNAGGIGARAKIDAARELALPVIMIARPAPPDRPHVKRIEDVLAWLGHEACLGE